MRLDFEMTSPDAMLGKKKKSCVNSMGLESPVDSLWRPIRGINSLHCICMYRDTGYEPHSFPQMNRIIATLSSVLILTVGQDTLLHGETLLVVSSSNAKDVSLPFVTEMVGFDLSAHALLIE